MINFIEYLTSVGQYKSFRDLGVGDTFWINGYIAKITSIIKSQTKLRIEYKRDPSVPYNRGIIYFYRDENSANTDFHLELADDTSGGLLINRNGTIWVSTNLNPKDIVNLAKEGYSKVIKLLKEPPYPKLTREVTFRNTGIIVSDISFELENLE